MNAHSKIDSGKMTSKGQVTIPIELRDDLNLTAGTRLDFVKLPDGGCAFYPVTGSVLNLAGMFVWDGPTVTLEQMDESIAAAAAQSMTS